MLGGLNAFILARVEMTSARSSAWARRSRCGLGVPGSGPSFDLEHVIAAGGRVVAEAKSVLVSYDYERGESVPVPDNLRKRLTSES